ncbi:site-specific integrase [Acetobacter persici]|uniref:site-specific integrase n=1 Tax=Acetobacter persici TaxID=1076596 RepID=UPI001EED8CA7|nr:tyrosine-type recombinase/integrase [Acetobacter persici]MCG0998148.1 tyrosine-type recombinase/integrase [Acetobacter persici]
MTVIRLKHLQKYTDNRGRVRCYLRVPGKKGIALPAPDDAKFLVRYAEAMASLVDDEPNGKSPPRSLSSLIVEWYRSPSFVSIKESTQITYRRILEYMREQDYAHVTVSAFKPHHIRKIINARASTPARANHILRMFRMLMSYAVDIGWLQTDPTIGIKRLRTKDEGAQAWSEEEIAQYQRHWPIGSRQRLAFDLMLHTGQRRSDIVGMGLRSIVGGYLGLTQIKTGKALKIPIHPCLLDSVVAWEGTGDTFLETRHGKPCSSNGFYNQFVKWCAAAGLPTGLSPHGLRKAAGRRLAEAGCTPHQIASILGHSTLAEVERYTASASQQQLADEAMKALRARFIF